MDTDELLSQLRGRRMVSQLSYTPRVQIVDEAGNVVREEPEKWTVEDLVVLPPDRECIKGTTVDEER